MRSHYGLLGPAKLPLAAGGGRDINLLVSACSIPKGKLNALKMKDVSFGHVLFPTTLK